MDRCGIIAPLCPTTTRSTLAGMPKRDGIISTERLEEFRRIYKNVYGEETAWRPVGKTSHRGPNTLELLPPRNGWRLGGSMSAPATAFRRW